jgi:sodium transport system permease protein
MTKPTEPRTLALYHAGPTLDVPTAAGLVAAALATYLVAGWTARLVGAPPLGILAAAQLGLAAPIVLLAWGARDLPIRATLGLRPPPPLALVAATLVGGAAWYVNVRLVAALGPLLPRAAGPLAGIIDDDPLAPTLLAVALIPALCEELLFRGVITGALARPAGRFAAVALSAALFAGYHLTLVQLAPIFLLALWLGALRLAARSVWPAVLAHALNNTLGILIRRDDLAPVSRALLDHPTLGLAAALGLLALGLALLPKISRL